MPSVRMVLQFNTYLINEMHNV